MVLSVIASGVFVVACYQDHGDDEPKVKPLLIKIFGETRWIMRHCMNDWLAALWMSYYASLICMFLSLGMLFIHIRNENDRQAYIYLTGAINAAFFVIGSVYYLAGSYNPGQYNFLCNILRITILTLSL